MQGFSDRELRTRDMVGRRVLMRRVSNFDYFVYFVSVPVGELGELGGLEWTGGGLTIGGSQCRK